MRRIFFDSLTLSHEIVRGELSRRRPSFEEKDTECLRNSINNQEPSHSRRHSRQSSSSADSVKKLSMRMCSPCSHRQCPCLFRGFPPDTDASHVPVEQKSEKQNIEVAHPRDFAVRGEGRNAPREWTCGVTAARPGSRAASRSSSPSRRPGAPGPWRGPRKRSARASA